MSYHDSFVRQAIIGHWSVYNYYAQNVGQSLEYAPRTTCTDNAILHRHKKYGRYDPYVDEKHYKSLRHNKFILSTSMRRGTPTLYQLAQEKLRPKEAFLEEQGLI